MLEATASRTRRAVEAPCQPKAPRPDHEGAARKKESLKQMVRLDRRVPPELTKSGVRTGYSSLTAKGDWVALRCFSCGTSGSRKMRRVGVSRKGCVESIANQDRKARFAHLNIRDDRSGSGLDEQRLDTR
jgi:hypothetical protein